MKVMYRGKINLRVGINKIALLSVAMGLPNIGGHYETCETGVLGPVALYGFNQGKRDLSLVNWTCQVGLKGQAMNLISSNPTSSFKWIQDSLITQNQQPLTWHKTYYNASKGDSALALDIHIMGKVQTWVNGQSIGRYWTTYATGHSHMDRGTLRYGNEERVRGSLNLKIRYVRG